jgi:WD40 repeat protein
VARSALSETPLRADSPYVGLTFFTEDKAHLFFGRDAEIAVIIGNLRAARLTVVYAESGVGKSSLLRAGVAARLRRQAETDLAARGRPRFLPVVFSSWSEDPVVGLISAIEQALRPLVADGTEVGLPRRPLGEAINAAAAATGAPLLLILDQFEEYLLYRSKHDQPDEFPDQLSACLSTDMRANFLISIREDMYAPVGDLFRGRLSNVYSNSVHLDYLDREGARAAIVKPLERYNEEHGTEISPEAGLVEAVLDGVQLGRGDRENGQAPGDGSLASERGVRVETTYLQLVMKRLWDEEMAAGSSVLRLETFAERLGGARTIIRDHLGRAIAALPPTQRDAAASIFSFLVTRAGTKIALSANDLAELSGVPDSEINPVLRRLAAADLHILRPITIGKSDTPPSYEIVHDALARPIVDWRTDYRRAQLAERLEHERRQKEEAQRHALEAEQREARERRRKRLAAAGLAVFLAAFLATAVAFAVVERKNSQDVKRANVSLNNVNVSNEISSRIGAWRALPKFGPAAAALAGLEAYTLSPTYSARRVVLGALQENVGMPLILSGHARSISSVAYSPRRPLLLASGSADGTVRLWNRKGTLVAIDATRPYVTVTSLAFRRDGRLLAASRGDGSIDLFELRAASGAIKLSRRRVLFPANKDCSTWPCYPVAFGPQGLLAWGGETGIIRLWDARDPSRIRTRPRREVSKSVEALAFSTEGKLAVASYSGVYAWRTGRRGFFEPPLRYSSSTAYSVAWAPDGSLAAGADGSVKVWDAFKRRPHVISNISGNVVTVGFAKRGSLLFAGGDNENVTAWDLKMRTVVGPPRQHSDTIEALAVSPDGRTLASAGDDDLVKLWRLDGARALARTVLGRRSVQSLAVAPDGRIAAADDKRVVVMNRQHVTRSSRPRTQTIPHAEWPVVFDGRLLAADPRTEPPTFAIWDTKRSCARRGYHRCKLFTAPARRVGGSVTSMALARDASVLAVGTNKGVVSVWDVSNPRATTCIARAKQASAINAIAFRPGQRPIFATAAEDGTVRLWRADGARHCARLASLGRPGVPRFPASQPALAVAFSDDGRFMASGGADQAVTVWNVQHPSQPRQLGLPLQQTSTILALAFSPEQRVLAAGDGDGSVCLYEIKSLLTVGSDRCLTATNDTDADVGSIDALAFDRSGAILSAGRDEPLIAWSPVLWGGAGSHAGRDPLVENICRLARRNLSERQWGVFFGTPLAKHRHKTCGDYPLR